MQGIRKYIILLIVGSAAFAALFFYLGYRTFHAPNDVDSASVFYVPSGQGLIRTARLLHEANLISNQDIFKVGVMLKGSARNLKAGEFLFPANLSMNDITEILVKGDVIQHKLTIVEGWTSWQIVDYLNSIENLTGEIEELPIEGSIMPESYHYTYNTNRNDILMRMRLNQRALIDRLWLNRADDLPFNTVEEAIILASIDRLRRNIRLQSDPTIIYGIDRKGFLDRGLRRSEIEDKTNPYNTYQIDRLPPTAIAHPGRASIEAVLNPMQTDDVYFVADGTGGHVFAETLSQHKKNVAQWRKIEDSRK